MFSSYCASFMQGCVIGHHYNWICSWQGTRLRSEWGCTCSWCILCSLNQPGSNRNGPNTYPRGKFTLKILPSAFCIANKALYRYGHQPFVDNTFQKPWRLWRNKISSSCEMLKSAGRQHCWWLIVPFSSSEYVLDIFWRYLTQYSLGN